MKILVAVFACALALTACKKKEDALTGAPTVGAVSFSNVTATGMTVSWGAGTDDATASADLQYKVLYSGTNTLADADSAEQNGTVAMDWTTATLTKVITGLVDSTDYSFAVLAKDTDGKIGFIAASSSTLCSGKSIYLASVTNGNLGGKSGADTLCTAQRPTAISAATVKALLSQGSSRAGCYNVGNDNCGIIGTTGQADWPLAASINYCLPDRTKKFGHTDANKLLVIDTPLILSATATTTLTAFNIAWGSSATNCSAWTSTSGTTIAGNAAAGNGTGFQTGAGASISCAAAATIYCVEQ